MDIHVVVGIDNFCPFSLIWLFPSNYDNPFSFIFLYIIVFAVFFVVCHFYYVWLLSLVTLSMNFLPLSIRVICQCPKAVIDIHQNLVLVWNNVSYYFPYKVFQDLILYYIYGPDIWSYTGPLSSYIDSSPSLWPLHPCYITMGTMLSCIGPSRFLVDKLNPSPGVSLHSSPRSPLSLSRNLKFSSPLQFLTILYTKVCM